MTKINIFILFFVFSFFSNISLAEKQKVIFGEAIVVDGDSLKIKGERIRLFGIDAFEIQQTCIHKKYGKNRCGQLAKLFLYYIINIKV